MEMEDAALSFQALAHETRLKAFRLIISAGRDGLPAGEIARLLEVPASTLSSHLAILERAGLIQSWRVQRSIFYAVEEEGVRDIVSFLTRNCCRGEPELCGFQVQTPAPRGKARKRA
ncbi:MAG: ArsR/SmtB family transcription factor [Alphaproteobacteria bacterium]